ncbi:MAG: hypothetical protein JW958_05130 [Candidatus Eisenbacteria bacterium]|nr:hypothetical protein [Candidatus Eisenbacteria bacterium]
MSRQLWARLLLLVVLVAFTATWVLAEDEHPDPRPITPMEVDPDGLEGLHAPTGTHTAEAAVDVNHWFVFLRVLLHQAWIIGL